MYSYIGNKIISEYTLIFETINEISKKMLNHEVKTKYNQLIIKGKTDKKKYVYCENIYKNCFNAHEMMIKEKDKNKFELYAIKIYINWLYHDFGIFYKPFDYIRLFSITDDTFEYTNEYFDKHLKFIGSSNLTLGLIKRFKHGKIYLRTLYEQFKQFNCIQKSVEMLNSNDFEDEDIIIYTISSNLNNLYTEEDGKKDLENVKKIIELIKTKNIKFVYFSSISFFKPNKNINIYSEAENKLPYGKYKFLIENEILKNLNNENIFIIRPSVIIFDETIDKKDNNTLINLSLNYDNFNVKFDLQTLKNNFTKPINIDKIYQIINKIIRNYSLETIYNIQGDEMLSYYDIVSGKIYNKKNKITFGDNNNLSSKYYESNFEYKL